MRRHAPRPLSLSLARVSDSLAPASLLAGVQRAWPGVAGPLVARESQPVSERAGTVTVACSSSVWAQELDLMSAELLERLEAALGHGRATRLRCVASRPGARR